MDDDKNLVRFRTTIQYLIEVTDIISHPVIYEKIFFFLFGFPEEEEKVESLTPEKKEDKDFPKEETTGLVRILYVNNWEFLNRIENNTFLA